MSREKAIELARLFHETYERLAPSFGYKTREASAVPWANVPKKNKSLMIAVADNVLAALPNLVAGKFTKLWRQRLHNATALFKMGKPPDDWFQSIVTGFNEALNEIDRLELSKDPK